MHLDDFHNGNSTGEEKTAFTAVELQELIESLLENVPKGKKEKRLWKEKVNKLMTTYNEQTGFKAYQIIH